MKRHSYHLDFPLFEKMYFNKEYMLFEARKQMFVNFMNKINYQFWLFNAKPKR